LRIEIGKNLFGGKHLLELRFQRRRINTYQFRVLADKAACEDRAGELLEVPRFESLDVPQADASFPGDVLQRHTHREALQPQPIAEMSHTTRVYLKLRVPSLTRPLHTVEASVIVVNWNRQELLARCLESLAAQAEGVSFEVILVDNGSTDGSLEMVRARFGAHARFSLQVIANSGNNGFCQANNQGIAVARGEFIALLNNDAEADANWLAALLSAFVGRPTLGMAASKILVFDDPKKIDKVGHVIYLDGQNWGRGHGEIDGGQYGEVEETLWPDGCAAMYRRAMLDEIGGFDEDLFAYADDAELGLRARIAGWKCLYIPTAVVRHHRGSTLGQLSTRRVELIERNRVLLVLKHFPGRLLWLNAGYYIARLAAGMWAGATGRGEVGRFPGLTGKLRLARAIWRANLEALWMTPLTLRKRRALRPLRRLSASETTALLRKHQVPLWTMMGGVKRSK